MAAAVLEWWGEPVRRRCARWRRATAAPEAAAPFRRLLGEARWASLPEPVRRRFSRHLDAGICVTYSGEVVECRISRLGRLLAQAARLIGGPLPLHADTHVAASVSVIGDAGGGGQYWTRQYARRDGFPQVIHSCKRFAGPTGLEEYLGFGFGIALRLDAIDASLIFASDHFYWHLGPLRLRIPNWLSPGRLVIGHVDLGGGRFAFTLDLVHRRLGELLHQLAVFEDGEP